LNKYTTLIQTINKLLANGTIKEHFEELKTVAQKNKVTIYELELLLKTHFNQNHANLLSDEGISILEKDRTESPEINETYADILQASNKEPNASEIATEPKEKVRNTAPEIAESKFNPKFLTLVGLGVVGVGMLLFLFLKPTSPNVINSSKMAEVIKQVEREEFKNLELLGVPKAAAVYGQIEGDLNFINSNLRLTLTTEQGKEAAKKMRIESLVKPRFIPCNQAIKTIIYEKEKTVELDNISELSRLDLYNRQLEMVSVEVSKKENGEYCLKIISFVLI